MRRPEGRCKQQENSKIRLIRIILIWDQIITSSLSMMMEMSPALERQMFILSYLCSYIVRIKQLNTGSHRTFGLNS